MDEQKKVYIVTSGEYSDYGINAVFSTKADAEAYVERYNRVKTWRSMQASVEEWDLDGRSPVNHVGQTAFQIVYSTRDYEPTMIWSDTNWYHTEDTEKTELPFEHVHHEDSLHTGTNEVHHRWETWVWAKDEDEALKIGADRIMPVLAEHQIEGVVPPKETSNAK